VTVINTGNLSMFNIILEDTGGILSGIFALVAGSASTVQARLDPAESLTLQYVLMPLLTGTAELPPARVSAVDFLQNEIIRTTTAASITIGAGMLPSEVTLLSVGVGILVALLVVTVLFICHRRSRRRAQ
jgi:hypothetical protein